MKLSLVITTYNWPEALSLVFESIKNQTILPDEVVIADDGSTHETKDLIKATVNLLDLYNEQYDAKVKPSSSKN